MKHIAVKNNRTGQNFEAILDEPFATAWVEHCKINKNWGELADLEIQIISSSELDDQKKLELHEDIKKLKGKNLSPAEIQAFLQLLIIHVLKGE